MPSGGSASETSRVVLDTNVLVSALLFEGVTARLVDLWQTRKIVCAVSKPILEEYLKVLAYPKFDLTDQEIRALIQDEFLPFVEIVKNPSGKRFPVLKDRADEKFLRCAQTARANYLLTGDQELLSVREIGRCRVVTPGDFLKIRF